jgi:hypothetical protein
MSATEESPLFEHESSDSVAQFTVWIVPVWGAGLFGIWTWDFGGASAVIFIAVVCLVLALGLRSSISVFPEQVKIVRKWFFLPYRIHRAPGIEDVWFGGDYGLAEGAVGIVVSMGGEEVHIGTSKNMHFLYEALSPFAKSRVQGH